MPSYVFHSIWIHAKLFVAKLFRVQYMHLCRILYCMPSAEEGIVWLAFHFSASVIVLIAAIQLCRCCLLCFVTGRFHCTRLFGFFVRSTVDWRKKVTEIVFQCPSNRESKDDLLAKYTSLFIRSYTIPMVPRQLWVVASTIEKNVKKPMWSINSSETRNRMDLCSTVRRSDVQRYVSPPPGNAHNIHEG